MQEELHQELTRAVKAKNLPDIINVRKKLETFDPNWIHTIRAKAIEAELKNDWDAAILAWQETIRQKPEGVALVMSFIRCCGLAKQLDRVKFTYDSLAVHVRYDVLLNLAKGSFVHVEPDIRRRFFALARQSDYKCSMIRLFGDDVIGDVEPMEDSGRYDDDVNQLVSYPAYVLPFLGSILIGALEWSAARKLMRAWLDAPEDTFEKKTLLLAESVMGLTGLLEDYYASPKARAVDYTEAEKKKVWIFETAVVHNQASHNLASLRHIIDFVVRTTKFTFDDICVFTSAVSLPVEDLPVMQCNEIGFQTYCRSPQGKTLGRFPNRKNEWLRHELHRLNPEHVELVVFKTVMPTMMKAVYNWLAAQDGKSELTAIIDILPLLSIDLDLVTETNTRADELIIQPFDKLMKLSSVKRFVHCEFSEIANRLAAYDPAGTHFRRAVYPVASVASTYRKPDDDWRVDGRIRVGVLGDTREDKGYPMVPKIISRSDDQALAVEWVVQLNRFKASQFAQDPISQETSAKLDAMPNVTLHNEFYTQDEFYNAFASLDVILLPYSERYDTTSSGLIVEAIELRILPIVPAGSMLEEVARQARAPHIAVSNRSVTGYVDAIKHCVEQGRTSNSAWSDTDLSEFYIELHLERFFSDNGLV